MYPRVKLLLIGMIGFSFNASAYPITSYLEMLKVSAVGYSWKTLTLSNFYTDPVVVCTYNLPSFASNEAVVRVQQVGANIQIKVQRPVDSTAVTASDVYCTISESGVYTYPIKYEAHTVSSSQTNYSSDWDLTKMVNIGSSPYKLQNYTKPVITGQVMSYNNPNFSTFWSSQCSSRKKSANNTNICIGKHTGQTVPTTPYTETLGYLIAEKGEYILSNAYVNINLGGDSIAGTGNSPPYSYSLSRTNAYATATQSAMDGIDGGWAVFFGTTPISNSLQLAIEEETIAGDTKRKHTKEQVSYWVMQPITQSYADLMINEVMYKQTTGIDEFIELAVISGGTILNYMISSQDGTAQNFRLPNITVNAGDFVIFHSAIGTTSSLVGIHHIYSQKTSTSLANGGDDVVLLKPSNIDATTLNGSGTHNVIPVDYVAYGTGSTDPVPVSINSVTVSWNNANNVHLGSTAPGQSIALTPNSIDSDTSVCWEKSTSGNASTCPSFIITRDTDASAFINSEGMDNTAAPKIKLTKTVLTIYDPYNGASNPKAIPGSVLEYIITSENSGILAADSNTIKLTDYIPDKTKLCVADSGYCKAPYLVDGSPSSGLSLGSTTYSETGSSPYTYSATVDSEGADANVTNFQAAMNGAFQSKIGVTAPSFSLKFRVVVE